MPKNKAARRGQAVKREEDAPLPRATFAAARAVALCVFAALLTVTPLIPSESAANQGTGAVLVMLWLLLLVAWLATGLVTKRLEVRFGRVDAAVLAFLAIYAISASVTATQGHARPTINVLWQWISLGTCFFLARQLLRTWREARTVCVVMVSLAVCLSVLAYYQYFYSMPRLRAKYEHEPEIVLREVGIDPGLDSPSRKLFEDRLRSTEPIATFALTNSFAGFLAPWLIAAVGIGALSWNSRQLRWPVTAGAVAIGLIVGFCLVLTKSRTAVLATMTGLLLLGLVRWHRGWRINWLIPAAAVILCLLLIAAAVLAGSIDWLVFSEAPKSVLYRLEYWRASAALIAEHPWFGCGPGVFQQRYAAYKLPEASETIAEPHNFLLEVWATSGSVTMIAFLTALGLFVWRLSKSGARTHETESTLDDEDSDREPRWIYAGALIGIIGAFPYGTIVGYTPEVALLWTGLPAAIVAAAALRPWSVRGLLPLWLPIVAVTVLTVNLLAAGGIGFVGVAQTWWLLAALCLFVADYGRPRIVLPRGFAAGLFMASMLLAALCHQTLYDPVLQCQAQIGRANALAAKGQIEQAADLYRQAAESDPFSTVPWMHLAALRQQQALTIGTDPPLAQFEEAVREILERDRQSQAVYRQLGDWWLALYRATQDSERLDRAIDCYRRRVELYPNSGIAHAQLAWAFYLTGNSQAAARESQVALVLDESMPHVEQKLARQHVFDSIENPLDCGNAKQLMQRLFDLKEPLDRSR